MTHPVLPHKKKFIVEYNVPTLEICIVLGSAALVLTLTLIYHTGTGGLFFLIIPIPILIYVFTHCGVEIDIENNTFNEYITACGIQISDNKGKLPPIHYILVKDTLFAARNSRGQITNSSDCYEVALVGEDRFKLAIIRLR